ncbi:MAG: pyridoxal phosphate-dependent aminotransferase [Candidatus Adiutrix sp.]|jgi:cystathionine beta-lyase|nr:pyridoxal phosphate-dependent aminotransferase [Candidatus Adiutrix sp.]
MEHNFDEIVSRKGTNCLKHDFAAEHGKSANVLPLWVADMDFKSPEPVVKALLAAVEHGVFGYPGVKEEYFAVLRDWFAADFGFEIKPGWLVRSPGVVFALNTAVRAFTRPGEAVMIQTPVYPPFFKCVTANERRLVDSELLCLNGRYAIDFDDFEKKMAENRVKLFILCSPHNPVGRVWRPDELRELGRICLKYGCLVVADEIHCDFAHAGRKHHIFPLAGPGLADIAIVCLAPSKTFNIAGLQVANIVIPNAALKAAFEGETRRAGCGELNCLGLVAGTAAYREGRPWLLELKRYLAGNFELLRNFLAENLPLVRLTEPEGTFMAWLDFRALGLNQEELNDLIVGRAGLWLNDGASFGRAGRGFQRMNLASPRQVIQQALTRLAAAIN